MSNKWVAMQIGEYLGYFDNNSLFFGYTINEIIRSQCGFAWKKGDRIPILISEKMGIHAGIHVLLIDAPLEAVDAIELPRVKIATIPSDQVFDHILFFVKSQAVMDQQFPYLMQSMAAGGKLWVTWPKGGRLGTDLTIKEVIRIGYSHGLVESANLRIDDTWTSLKFTHPKPGKTYHNSYGKLS